MTDKEARHQVIVLVILIFFASSPAADGSLAILLMCWLFPSFFASSPAADGSLAYSVDLAGRNVCTFLLLLITWSASPPRELESDHLKSGKTTCFLE